MARRKWVQIDGNLIEVDPHTYLPADRPHGRVHGDAAFEGARGTHGEDISTRTKYREYLKVTGLAPADDYSPQYLEGVRKAREQAQRRERRETIERVFYTGRA